MNTEIRSFELRVAEDEEFALEGTALSYDTLSPDLGGFFERIQVGAFARSLRANDDVKCLLNHDPNHVLGRRKSGTLALHDETDGLKFRCQLDRNNSTHRDVYAMVKRGDVNECSFAFVVAKGGEQFDQITHQGKQIVRRTVTDADLRDVSVVTYPAYSQGTRVNARTQLNTHVGTQLLSTGAIDHRNRQRADEIGRMIAADRVIEVAKETVAAANRTPSEIDAYHRRRAEEFGRIVAEDLRKGDIA